MFWVGGDLGQAQDYSAVAVNEIVFTPTGRDENGSITFDKNHHCRFAKRLPLGMTYPAQIGEIDRMMNTAPLKGNCRLAVDATGVGRPVVDSMREKHMNPLPIVITAGLQETFDPETGFYYVPKRILISNLQILLGNNRMRFAGSLEVKEVLVHEITNFKLKITEKANDTYEAWREGDHDDLVLALAMAAWAAEKFAPLPAKPTLPRNPWMPNQRGLR